MIPPADAGRRARPADAFGLRVSSPAPIAGVEPLPATTGAGSRTVALRLVGRTAALDGWPRARAERVSERRRTSGRAWFTIDAEEHAGYLLWAAGYGRHRLSADGTQARCAAPSRGEWRWQAFVTAQLLPFAAVLQGLEVFHAGAVAVDGRVIAFMGESFAGKSTCTLGALAIDGSAFLTDDVLALEADGGGRLVAHAGAGVASVRADTLAALPPSARDRLGATLSRHDGTRRVRVERAATPLSLAAVYLLEHGPGSRLTIADAPAADPRPLLGATFNAVVRTPARLERQLDVCARIAGKASVRRVRVPTGAGIERVRRRLADDIAGVLR